jgi:hypothetical protein
MKMAKIINLPTLCKLTEHQKNGLVIQVLELREKMNSIVDLISDQQEKGFASASSQRAYGRRINVDERR